MNQDESSDGGMSEASRDAIDLSSVDLSTDNDPSDDDDSTSFYECLEDGADRQLGEVRKHPLDEGEGPATFTNGRYYGNTGQSACNSRDGHPDFGCGPSAKRFAIETVGFFNIGGGGGSVFEGLALKKLVQRVIGHGTINRGTNALCAQILNHPEVNLHPEVLPIHPSYNGKIRFYIRMILSYTSSI